MKTTCTMWPFGSREPEKNLKKKIIENRCVFQNYFCCQKLDSTHTHTHTLKQNVGEDYSNIAEITQSKYLTAVRARWGNLPSESEFCLGNPLIHQDQRWRDFGVEILAKDNSRGFFNINLSRMDLKLTFCQKKNLTQVVEWLYLHQCPHINVRSGATVQIHQHKQLQMHQAPDEVGCKHAESQQNPPKAAR